jgi:hypothetical protein
MGTSAQGIAIILQECLAESAKDARGHGEQRSGTSKLHRPRIYKKTNPNKERWEITIERQRKKRRSTQLR